MRPYCKCHAYPMIKNGNGKWLCRAKHRQRRRSYNDTPRQKENTSERVRKHRAAGKLARRDEIMEALSGTN